MVARKNTFNTSFQGKPSQRPDRKALALMRRADTERDSHGFSMTGERKRGVFVDPNMKVTLPRLQFLEKPDEGDLP
jgi:hypothetical protein